VNRKIKRHFFPKLSFWILPFLKRPFIIFLNITQRCNLRCSYCFGQYYSEIDELTFTQASRILSELYALGARRLALGGGEPLLYEDIDELIKFAIKLGFDVGLNSNGILVSQHLSALGLLSNLSISLDGASSEINDVYRGRGSFENAIQGIESAHEAGIALHICCTLTNANIDSWRKVLALGKKYNAMVEFSPLYPQFQGMRNTLFPKPVEKEKLRKTILDIIEEKRKGGNILFSEATYRLILNWSNYEQDTSSSRERGHPVCLAGKKMLSLDSHGTLFPCFRISNQVKGRNCLEMGVREAYKGLPAPPCKSCMWACFIEYNSLLNLSFYAILNILNVRFSHDVL
jgi:MoaA/NifB/PqqE/SkfB family radical SAM enzyme